MHSKKLEDISNTSLRSMSSYLSEVYTSEVERFSLAGLMSGANVGKAEAFAVVAHLIDEDVLSAKVEVRCPVCDQREGIYSRKSEIPSREASEFCGHQFQMDDEENWEVKYEFEGDIDSDFFRNLATA